MIIVPRFGIILWSLRVLITRSIAAYKRPNKPEYLRYPRNDYIRAQSMLVVDDTGNSLGELSRDEALRAAQEQELDLVLIAPQANPPVARIMSWSKFKYDKSKKQRESRGRRTELKEMWFKPKIEEADIMHKVKRVKEFISKGNRVKLTIRAKGRVTREDMKAAMTRVLPQVGEFADIDTEPKFEGRNYAVFIKPRKHGDKKQDSQSDSQTV